MFKYYKVIVTNKQHKYVCSAAVDTENAAIDFIQAVNDNNRADHFFTVNEIDQDGVVIRSIMDKATYIGTTTN